MRLAYSLLTYVTSTKSLSETAGREEVPGETGIPLEGTATPPINQKLVTSALDAFFSEQNPDGMWDKGNFNHGHYDNLHFLYLLSQNCDEAGLDRVFLLHILIKLSSFTSQDNQYINLFVKQVETWGTHLYLLLTLLDHF